MNALALSEQKRADLASTLIDSFDTTVDENVEATWQEEIASRIANLDSGKAKTIPWEEVRRRTSSKLTDGR